MNYMLLLYSDYTSGPQDGTPEQAAEMEAWFAVTHEMEAAGIMRGGEALQSIESSTTVRVRNGETGSTDGPFAETKEQLGGYYIIEVDNLDEAIEWAAKMPNAPYGSVEIRPVMELPEM